MITIYNMAKALVLLMLFFSNISYSEVFLVKNVNVITMENNRILPNHQVWVDDGKIVAVEPKAFKSVWAADQEIDGNGGYLIPGLSDTHFHQYGSDFLEHLNLFKLLIANGITSVRSMAEWDGQDTISIRWKANQKSELAPYFYTVGNQLEETDVPTVAKALDVVRYHKEKGYDFIKIHGNLAKNVYFAVLEESEKLGIPVVGHAQRNLPLEYSLRLYSIAHMEDIVMVFSNVEELKIADIDRKLAKSIAKQVKESGIFVTPTLSIIAMIEEYTDEERYKALVNRGEVKYLADKVLRDATKADVGYRSEFFMSKTGRDLIRKIIKGTITLTKALNDEGVPMLVGSDNFGIQVTGFSFHDEMESMRDAGMSNYDVLRAATVNSARFLGRFAQYGTISVGKNADFILLEDNPLKNISNARNVKGVMLKEQWHGKKELDSMVSSVAEQRNHPQN